MHEVRSNSIIETSLTELAFIFFFILLTVSAWKINSIVDDVYVKEKENADLSNKNQLLTESLKTASTFAQLGDKIKPEELFKELTSGRKAVKELAKVQGENKILQEKVDSLGDLVESKDSVDKLVEQITQNKKLKDILKEAGYNPDKPLEEVSNIVQKNSDIKGQNINLRGQLEKAGNGLDHPPCWADPETGKIQYLFNAEINENSIEFKPGWPESRATQATGNPNITRIPAVYRTNDDMWKQTKYLYEESVRQECRHFVYVNDNADSKSSFKRYLLGIENHFYKYLKR